jgi:hypothetical protein
LNLKYDFHVHSRKESLDPKCEKNMIKTHRLSNKTSVIKLSGSPLSVIQHENYLKYKEKVLKVNEQKIYKKAI